MTPVKNGTKRLINSSFRTVGERTRTVRYAYGSAMRTARTVTIAEIVMVRKKMK